jgi:signal transduction histidine kinase
LDLGVLPTFRLFIGMQLILSALGVIGHWLASFRAGSEIVTLTLFSILELGLLVIYLSIPGLQRSLKSFYLPLGIVWAAAGPILDPYLELHLAGNSAPQILTELVLWRQIILLLTPLIVTSWQYGVRQMGLFCIVTAAVNIGLLSLTLGPQEMIARSLLGVVLTETVIFFLVGHMILNMMAVQRDQRQRLTQANKRLAQYASTLEQLTISRERNRLAREMHDVLAHTLSGVAVELEGVRAMLRRDPEQSEVLVSHSLQAVREGLTETRRALQELRARPLEDLGLGLALQALAASFAGRDNLQIDLDIAPDLGDYPAEVQQCVYRIAQEALANVASHAQARSVRLGLHREADQLRLVVRDDGCGFDPDTPAGDRQFGLLGMRERAEMVGGKLSIKSETDKGTQISFCMEVTDGQPTRAADPFADM